MNEKYWEKYYRKNKHHEPSNFAKFVLDWFKKSERIVELGCGDKRDLDYFVANGMIVFGVDRVTGYSAEEFIKKCDSPNYVYTRFFWHAIDRKLQLAILKWAKKYIFIEARTTEDKDTKKIFDNHDRNYVDVKQLLKDLKDHSFKIEYKKVGRGLSPYKGEDPHLIRIIAQKNERRTNSKKI